MLRRRLLFPVIMLMLLNGCGTVYRTAEQVSEATTVQTDNYAKTTWLKGPYVAYGDGRSVCMFRSLITKSGDPVNQLYVTYRAHDWAFLDHAYDSNGSRLKILLIDRDVTSSALITETVAIEFDDDYLRAAATTGMDISIRGKKNNTTIRLAPHFVQGHLFALDKFTSTSVK